MARQRLPKWIVRGVLMIALLTGGTLMAKQEADVYVVQFIDWDRPLAVRAAPGMGSPTLATVSEGDEVVVTGAGLRLGTQTWVPIHTRYPLEVDGWVNRRYLVAQVEPEVFCADARIPALVETIRVAVREGDGSALADLLEPSRGLYLGGLYWSHDATLSVEEARGMFSDDRVRDWGVGEVGESLSGSLRDFVVPRLRETLLVANASIACQDNQDGLMAEGRYIAGAGIAYLPFYSVQRPGAPGHELDWSAWALGFDYWEGEPVLSYLSYYFWTP